LEIESGYGGTNGQRLSVGLRVSWQRWSDVAAVRGRSTVAPLPSRDDNTVTPGQEQVIRYIIYFSRT
jgi:hypothetical protein